MSILNKYDPPKKLKFQLCLSYAGCDEMTFLYGQEYPIVQILKKMFFGLGGVYFALEQKTSFTKKFSIGPRNLIPDWLVQNPKFDTS